MYFASVTPPWQDVAQDVTWTVRFRDNGKNPPPPPVIAAAGLRDPCHTLRKLVSAGLNHSSKVRSRRLASARDRIACASR
jgi:hypothetical protein